MCIREFQSSFVEPFTCKREVFSDESDSAWSAAYENFVAREVDAESQVEEILAVLLLA